MPEIPLGKRNSKNHFFFCSPEIIIAATPSSRHLVNFQHIFLSNKLMSAFSNIIKQEGKFAFFLSVLLSGHSQNLRHYKNAIMRMRKSRNGRETNISRAHFIINEKPSHSSLYYIFYYMSLFCFSLLLLFVYVIHVLCVCMFAEVQLCRWIIVDQPNG